MAKQDRNWKEWRAARASAYDRGEYTLSPPPVYSGGWDKRAWCNHVRFNDPRLTGFDDGSES